MTALLPFLLVDDDLGHCELVRRNLRRAGITNEIHTVHDGQSALDFVHAAAGPVLLLLDINMPGLSGIEVLRRLKGDPQYCHTPIIMLTTTDDPREVERCYALGCNVYLTKPVNPLEFVEAVRRLGLFLAVVRLPGALPPA